MRGGIGFGERGMVRFKNFKVFVGYLVGDVYR